jgi:chemotaxis response regulator CheB
MPPVCVSTDLFQQSPKREPEPHLSGLTPLFSVVNSHLDHQMLGDRAAVAEWPYPVRVAGDLGTAVDMLKECAPDLLMTSLYIAEISGHDAAQYLCSRCPKMRVLIVAGLPQDQRTENRTTSGLSSLSTLANGSEDVARAWLTRSPKLRDI